MVKIKTENHEFGFDISLLEHLLFLIVGRAMTRIQNFEDIVGTILCSLSPQAENITLENVDNIMGKLDSKTLGHLVGLMKQKVAGDELHDRLVRAKEGRNFIAHHALRQFSDLNEEETISLVKKIEAIIVDIEDVRDLLIAELSAQNVTHISEVYINLETEEIEDVEGH
jgi:hypothetical protein